MFKEYLRLVWLDEMSEDESYQKDESYKKFLARTRTIFFVCLFTFFRFIVISFLFFFVSISLCVSFLSLVLDMVFCLDFWGRLFAGGDIWDFR